MRCVPGSMGVAASAAAFSASGHRAGRGLDDRAHGAEPHLRRAGERLRLAARVRDGRRQRAPVEHRLVRARERRAVDLVRSGADGCVDDGARARHVPDRRVDGVRGGVADDVLAVLGVAGRERHARRLDVPRGDAGLLDRVDHLSHLVVVPVQRRGGGLRLRRHAERERGAVRDRESRAGTGDGDRPHRRARGDGLTRSSRRAADGNHGESRHAAQGQCAQSAGSHVSHTSPAGARVTRPQRPRAARDTGATRWGCAACGA